MNENKQRTLDDIQKGDMVIDSQGIEKIVSGRIEDIVFLSYKTYYSFTCPPVFYGGGGVFTTNTAVSLIDQLKEEGYTIKPPTPTKWEPKEEAGL